MTAIGNDAARNIDVPEEDVNAFLDLLTPEDASKKKPSAEEEKVVGKQPPQEDDSARTVETEETEVSAEEPEAEETEEEAAEEKETKHTFADDGAYVKVKVGDEEHEVPVKELQRLYGQEKALTQKSMEVAEARKRADADIAKGVAATTALLERAQKNWEPYSKIDFVLAAKDLSAEDYTNLRQAAQAAWENVQFLQTGVNDFVTQAAQRQSASLREQAKETLKVLAGPVEQGGIEGWNEELYGTIAKFAVEAGLKQEIVNNLVDASAIRLLNEARLYRLGKSKVVTKRINKTPTKVIKTKTAPETNTSSDKTNVSKAAKKLRLTGSTDDAAELFMASWAARDADSE